MTLINQNNMSDNQKAAGVIKSTIETLRDQ